MDDLFAYKRISVIGTSGTGKSTLAKQLAKQIGGEYIELDAFYHGPDWTPTSDDIFIRRVRERMKAERWVVDASYSNRAGQFEESGLIIWLDYPFRIALARILRRTFQRLLTKEELWNGNRESWRMTFSRDSIIVWFFQTYWKRRREIPRLFEPHIFPNAQKIRLRHPREAQKLLTEITMKSSSSRSSEKAE
jgi:adenylate kinase family enzyme